MVEEDTILNSFFLAGEGSRFIQTKHCDGLKWWWYDVIYAQCSECHCDEIQSSAGKRRG